MWQSSNCLDQELTSQPFLYGTLVVLTSGPFYEILKQLMGILAMSLVSVLLDLSLSLAHPSITFIIIPTTWVTIALFSQSGTLCVELINPFLNTGTKQSK
jgi:ABC-type polysaccharide/polyol phosphate export permease